VLNLVKISGYKDLPDNGAIESIVEAECDPPTTDYLPPNAATWFVGDRTIICLRSDSSVPIGPHG
jgi:hypothetical protein